MLNTIKYFRKAYINSIINYMGIENGGGNDLPQEKQEQLEKLKESKNAGEEIKILKQMIEDGIIDKNEAIVLKIAEEKGYIEAESRPALKQIIEETFQNGFSSNNEKHYTSLTNFIGIKTGQYFPTWEEIEFTVRNNLGGFDQMLEGSKLADGILTKGIKVNPIEGTIEARYDRTGNKNDTLVINFEGSGKITNTEWKDVRGEDNSFENKATINNELLDNNKLLKDAEASAIAANNSEIARNYNNENLAKMEGLVYTVNNNPKYKNIGLNIKTEGNKVKIAGIAQSDFTHKTESGKIIKYKQGDPIKTLFTIPTLVDGKIVHGENLDKIADYSILSKWIDKRIGIPKELTPEEQTAIANTLEERKDYNNQVITFSERNIDSVQNLLTDNEKVVKEGTKIKIYKGRKELASMQINLKDNTGKEMANIKDKMKIPNHLFKKWVKDTLNKA